MIALSTSSSDSRFSPSAKYVSRTWAQVPRSMPVRAGRLSSVAEGAGRRAWLATMNSSWSWMW